MAGPTEILKKEWDSIREHLTLDDPTQSSTYLGCDHAAGKVKTADPEWNVIFQALREHVLPEKARGDPRVGYGKPQNSLECWMCGCIDQCVAQILPVES